MKQQILFFFFYRIWMSSRANMRILQLLNYYCKYLTARDDSSGFKRTGLIVINLEYLRPHKVIFYVLNLEHTASLLVVLLAMCVQYLSQDPHLSKFKCRVRRVYETIY